MGGHDRLLRPERAIIIARHGESTWTQAGRFAGQLDVELSTDGQRQAASLATAIAGDLALSVGQILASDLRRARDTASVVASRCGLAFATDRRVREEYLGRWQGLDRREVAAANPAGFARWTDGDVGPYDGREGLAAVAARAVPAVLEALALGPARQALLVVTHANTAAAIIGALAALPVAQWFEVGDLRPAHRSVLVPNEEGVWTLDARDLAPNSARAPA